MLHQKSVQRWQFYKSPGLKYFFTVFYDIHTIPIELKNRHGVSVGHECRPALLKNMFVTLLRFIWYTQQYRRTIPYILECIKITTMNVSRHFFITTFLLILYWASVLHTAIFLPQDLANFLFSESGAFEIFSPYLWFLLAVVCLCGHFTPTTCLTTSITAVLFALREMDLHKSLFGMSFLKTNFYRSDIISLSDKIFGGLICIVLLLLAIYLGKTFFKHLRHTPRPWPAAYSYTIFAFILFVASKYVDRLKAQLMELFDTAISDRSAVIIQSLEESTEMILPVLLCIAVFFYQRPLKPPKTNHKMPSEK